MTLRNRTPALPSPPKQFLIKIAGVWKTATVWIKVNGVWKQATPFIKVAGIWK